MPTVSVRNVPAVSAVSTRCEYTQFTSCECARVTRIIPVTSGFVVSRPACPWNQPRDSVGPSFSLVNGPLVFGVLWSMDP